MNYNLESQMELLQAPATCQASLFSWASTAPTLVSPARWILEAQKGGAWKEGQSGRKAESNVRGTKDGRRVRGRKTVKSTKAALW